MTPADVVGITAVLLAGCCLLAVLGLARAYGLGAEASRKLAHMGSGGLAMSFPWVFSGPAAVLTVCGLALVVLTVIATAPALRTRFGSALYGVGRHTRGEFYLPASVAVLYLLSRGDRWTYEIPLLVLLTADSAAALIGGRYGKVRFSVFGGEKTLMGSAAFLCAAFFSVGTPLMLSGIFGRGESVAIALNAAAAASLLEAVCGRGLDNLLLPPAIWAVLYADTVTPMPWLEINTAMLSLSLAMFIALRREGAFAEVRRRQRTLIGAGRTQ